jgi:uncharacterized protein (DUF1015 family)
VAEIHPFRGLRYNQSIIGDPGQVICPPYDVISPQLRQELHHRSEYNFIRLEDGWELPNDTAANSKYTRAAATLTEWLEAGVLQPEEKPAVYVHDHYFTYENREYRRRAIISCVRLTEWEDKVVRPHEGTLSNAKTDRLSLLWALQANTSPILVLYEDSGRQIAALLEKTAGQSPVINTGDIDGERHVLWAITEPAALAELAGFLTDQPLYIADGHHRYESALNHQRERRACTPAADPDEPFDYVMMNLLDFNDPGLLILPPHRLVKGIPPTSLNTLCDRLTTFFDVETMPLELESIPSQLDDFLTADTGETRLVIYGPERDCIFKLKLRDPEAASRMMPAFHSDLYKNLAVSVVQHVLLEKLLDLDIDSVVLDYCYDRRQAIERVKEREFQLAVLLGPMPSQTIKDIADIGERMPRKSTYFYPKAPSGLVLYRMA